MSDSPPNSSLSSRGRGRGFVPNPKEPKIENSGIKQGTFVKRHRIPRPSSLGGLAGWQCVMLKKLLKFEAFGRDGKWENQEGGVDEAPLRFGQLVCRFVFFYKCILNWMAISTRRITMNDIRYNTWPYASFRLSFVFLWVLVPRGGVYTYEDLRVGRSISIYSRVFRIIGADDYTRKFYKAGVCTVAMPPWASKY